jgi:hypothetical protein
LANRASSLSTRTHVMPNSRSWPHVPVAGKPTRRLTYQALRYWCRWVVIGAAGH